MPEDELASTLEHPDLETRIAAIERASLDPQKYARRVAALIPQFPSEACFVLERVGRFGDAMISPLLELFESATDETTRVLATLGLDHFKQHVDNCILLKAIHVRSEYQCLACRALAWLDDKGALPDLLAELHRTSAASEWDRMVSLISSIEALGGTVPLGERKRLIAEGPPLTRKMLDVKTGG
jgi:hypothetical protein